METEVRYSPDEITAMRDLLIRSARAVNGIPDDSELSSVTMISNKKLQRIKEAVASYPDDFVVFIRERIAKDDGNWTIHLVGGPLDHHMILDYFHFNSVGSLSRDMMCSLVRGLHHYPELPKHKSFSEADDLTVSRCFALMKFTTAMDTFTYLPEEVEDEHDRTKTIFKLKDQKLIDLALQYPQHAEMLSQAIRDRFVDDADFLRSLVESPAVALQEGSL